MMHAADHTTDTLLARRMLDRAARAAARGLGRVEPNPLVGCVIARGENVLGIGHHEVFGQAHAEPRALSACARRGHDPRGATAYVTLEPCGGHGKNPPCVEALHKAGIARVIYARSDPSPGKGGGAAKLRALGIETVQTDVSALAWRLSEPFLKRCATDLPWVIAKWAQTLDGRIATRTGESKWISGPRARERVHVLRGRVDAILTGLGTVLADDPLLTARARVKPRRIARRVLLDSDLDVSPECQLVRTARDVPLVVACEAANAYSAIDAPKRGRLESAGAKLMGVSLAAGGGLNLREVLSGLRARFGISTVLVEAGPRVLGSLLEHDLIDEACVYIAPMVLGDDQAMGVARGRIAERLANAVRWDLIRHRALGNDLELVYRRCEPHWDVRA